MKIFFLGDTDHPNTQNWVKAFRNYGNCEVHTWSLPWPKGKLGKLKRVLAFLSALFTLRKKIRAFDPDIIIGYRLTSYGFIAACNNIRPVVIAQQGETDVWPQNHWSTPFKEFLARYAIKKSALVHVWSPFMAEAVYKMGGAENKVLILPRGIDLKKFNYSSNKPVDQLRIIASRALHPDYGYPVMIQGIYELKQKNIPVLLKIAGKGSEEQFLKEMVSRLELESEVVFLGRIDNEALNVELQQSNVYLSMPVTEGTSASLFEAMACYCLPVVSDLPANRQWIQNGGNGYLVPVGDVETLSGVLEKIAGSMGLFRDILLNNRLLVENKASQETNTKVFVEKYKSLLKDS